LNDTRTTVKFTQVTLQAALASTGGNGTGGREREGVAAGAGAAGARSSGSAGHDATMNIPPATTVDPRFLWMLATHLPMLPFTQH